MKQALRPNILKDERGMATIESVPLIVVFIVLVAYMLGSFGIIHTGILHSIAARTYAFETFRHRTSLIYLRENLGAGTEPQVNFAKVGMRYHGVMSETYANNSGPFQATARPITLGMISDALNDSNVNVHNNLIRGLAAQGQRVQDDKIAVSPAWVMVQYGICIDSKCGD